MKATVILNHEDAVIFAKRLSIVKADATVLYLTEGKIGKILCADSVTADETKQSRVSTIATVDGEEISCTVKTPELVSMLMAVLSYGEPSQIKILQTDSVVKIGKGNIILDIPLVSEGKRIERINDENVSFKAQVGRADFASLIKEVGKFYDPEGRKNELFRVLELKVGRYTFSLTGSTGFVFGTKQIPAIATGESVIAIPGIFADTIGAALASTKMEKVSVCADNKYIHVVFDVGCIVSVRLSASCMDLTKLKEAVNRDGVRSFSVDKAKLDGAVRILQKKISLSKTNIIVPVKLTGTAAGLVVSVCDNRIQIPLSDGEAEGVDMYMSTSILNYVLDAAAPGNVLIRSDGEGDRSVLILGNGDTTNGFKADACRMFVACVAYASGEKLQSQFASGVEGDKAEKEAEDGKPASDEKGVA